MSAPTFSAKSQLARYIDEVNRLSNKRAAVAAFLPDPPSSQPDNDHMSVNTLEMETLGLIAAYHRFRQGGSGKVALCVHKVHEYNDAATKSGIDVRYDRQSTRWHFTGAGGRKSDAYKHRPVKRPDYPAGSPSHAGVEFARMLQEHRATQFARRLASKRRFHLL